jgi:RNA polymerase sigma-70 factor (ECF subfamily)
MAPSAHSPTREVTTLLRRLSAGDKSAADELFPQIYTQLKRFAAAQLRNERPDHTLQATALVNEAYLKLTQGGPPWKDRTHFFALAAKAMRRILTDHARKRNAEKRDGAKNHVEFDDALYVSSEQSDLIAVVDEALEELAHLDPRQAQIVELRFFGGLSEEEIAEILKISSRTVKRDWAMARAWLRGKIQL